MPQFDPTHYISQIFWCVICFCLFWAMMKYWVVPTLDRLAKNRQDRLEAILNEASKLEEEAGCTMQKARAQADEVRSSLQAELQEAQKKAQDEYIAYTQEVKVIFDEKMVTFRQDLEQAKSELLDALHDESKGAALFLTRHYHVSKGQGSRGDKDRA